MYNVSGPPILLLSAPKIAGLLPARVDPPRSPVTFTYTNPQLDRLAPSKQQTLLSSARDLLDVVVKLASGEASDLDLMLAQSVFFQAVGGQPIGQRSTRVVVEAAAQQSRQRFKDDMAAFARESQQDLATLWQRLQAESAARRDAFDRRTQELLAKLDKEADHAR